MSGTDSKAGGHEEEQEKQEEGQGDTVAENSRRIRVRLGGSIYLWACGETEENGDAALKLPDILIGWLILMVRRTMRQLTLLSPPFRRR